MKIFFPGPRLQKQQRFVQSGIVRATGPIAEVTGATERTALQVSASVKPIRPAASGAACRTTPGSKIEIFSKIHMVHA